MIVRPTTYKRILSISASSLLAAYLLSACGAQPRDTYDLSINSVASDGIAKHKKIQILIEKPDAVKAFDGQDIVIKQGGALAYLKKAQWSDRLPDLIQARLIQAFDNSDHFGGVGRPGDGLAINYRILTDIRSFGINVANGHDVASLEIAVKIMDDRNGSIIASRVFSAQSPVTGINNDQYVGALDRAFKKITADIVSWTISSV